MREGIFGSKLCSLETWPKLKDYIGQMKQNVARVMELLPDRVNVKATTTEGMGFEGEGLGISAQAAALIEYTRRGV